MHTESPKQDVQNIKKAWQRPELAEIPIEETRQGTGEALDGMMGDQISGGMFSL